MAKLYPVYSTGSILVSFPTQWSRMQSGSRNSIYFMNNSCDHPPLLCYRRTPLLCPCPRPPFCSHMLIIECHEFTMPTTATQMATPQLCTYQCQAPPLSGALWGDWKQMNLVTVYVLYSYQWGAASYPGGRNHRLIFNVMCILLLSLK